MGFKIKSIFGGGATGSNQPEASTVESIDVAQSIDNNHLPSTEAVETKKQNVASSSSPEEVDLKPETPTELPAKDNVQPLSTENSSDEDEPKKPVSPRRKPRNQEELLLDALPERANSSPDHLKSILQGKILIEVMPSNKKFLIEAAIDKPCTVTEASSQVTADCTISLHGKDLMRISDGDLNPQILMLSHKAKVSGNPKLATYIFNLIAPYSSNF